MFHVPLKTDLSEIIGFEIVNICILCYLLHFSISLPISVLWSTIGDFQFKPMLPETRFILVSSSWNAKY